MKINKRKEKYINGKLYRLCACGACNKYFEVDTSTTQGRRKKYFKSHWWIGKTQPKEMIEKRKKARKGYTHSKETLEKMRRPRKNKFNFRRGPLSEENKQNIHKFPKGHIPWNKNLTKKTNKKLSVIGKKISKSLSGKKQSEEVIKKRAESSKGRKSPMDGKHHTKKAKEKISKASLKLWKSPLHREKVFKKMSLTMKIRPNKPETIVLNILTDLYPSEWKYTGDFSFMINGKNPDFTNINGQKKLIELFGDYWHKGENPQDRIDTFKPFGYDTLVIWESELKDINKVKNKIMKFNKGYKND